MWRRLRLRIARWLVGEVPRGHMVPLFGGHSYLYIDFYGQVWKLRATGDEHSPLMVTLEYR